MDQRHNSTPYGYTFPNHQPGYNNSTTDAGGQAISLSGYEPHGEINNAGIYSNNRMDQDVLDDTGQPDEIVRAANTALISHQNDNISTMFPQGNYTNRLFEPSRIDAGIVGEPFGNHFINRVPVVDLDPVTSYHNRLQTYANWPRDVQVSPHSMARAGLVYLGQDDRTQCEFCRGILYSWDDEDDPLVEHQKHFKDCDFLQGSSWEVLDRLLHEERQQLLYEQRQLQENRIFSDNTNSTTNSYNTSQSNHLNSQTIAAAAASDDSKLTAAIDIVKQMGYEDRVIQKAIQNILLHQPNIQKDNIKSALLLDNIFELEENESLPESDNEEAPQEHQNVSSKGIAIVNQTEPSFACATFQQINHHGNLGSTEAQTLPTICRAACTTVDNVVSPNMDKLSVEKEHLMKNVMCNLCFSKKIGMLFLPCRHMIACEDCGPVIKECLKCSRQVVATVRIYMT